MAKSMSGEMAVYLLFHNSGLGNTLFKIDLPPMDSIKNSKSSSSTSKHPPLSINPILELSSIDYPDMMSCAQFGSKLYFFGGLIKRTPPPPSPPQDKKKNELAVELLNHVLPRDVRIFDTTSNSTSMELGAEMASGKVKPIVFVSKGMIYVLSAGRAVSCELCWWWYQHKTTDWLGTGDLMGHVKLFERYDPVENKWQVLDDSPLKSLSYLKDYLLLEDENQRKVVITSEGNVSHLVYDLDEDLWLSSSASKPKDMLQLVDNGSCHYVGGFCYGVLPDHRVFRLGPFNLNKDVESTLSNFKMSLVDSQDVLLLAAAWIGTCKLQHLGGGYFILLSASPANDNLGIPQPITRKVMINIFKETLPTAGASTQVDTASSFNAKIVFSQNYVCNINFECDGKFLSCFLVQSPVPTGRARQMIEDCEPFEGEALFRDVPAKNDRSS